MWIRALWFAVLLYVAVRGALYWAQYRGSDSDALRKQAEAHFSDEDIARGVEYARRGFAVRVAWSAIVLGALVFLVQSGAVGAYADRMLQWTGGRWYAQAAGVVASLVLAYFLIRLPFEYYFGYVLERRYGFSTMSLGAWALLVAKNLGLALAFCLIAGLAWFAIVRHAPRLWVAVVPAAFLGLQIVLAFLLPLLLVPLYFDARPLEAGRFRDDVESVLKRAGVQARQIYVVDASRYSTHTNAFFAGLGPSKNIFLFDTLLADHEPEEALTVVAHEAGHWRGRHILKGIALAFVGALVGCVLLAAIYPRLAAGGGAVWRPLSDPGSLPALLLLILISNFFTLPIASGVSRSFEREADRAAVELTGDSAACVQAERRIARTNHAQILPHPLVVFWYYSHPPPLERIELAHGG